MMGETAGGLVRALRHHVYALLRTVRALCCVLAFWDLHLCLRCMPIEKCKQPIHLAKKTREALDGRAASLHI